ncbi:hypothetical protein [Methanocaldococcus infernus]|uniref:hypothetical protein n=1 Tax=Methanocaldococcus infernus TaxID=67760 RepID=UPI0012F6989E|nr:hypothetical protein [Methanocaldococcus infernus]
MIWKGFSWREGHIQECGKREVNVDTNEYESRDYNKYHQKLFTQQDITPLDLNNLVPQSTIYPKNKLCAWTGV